MYVFCYLNPAEPYEIKKKKNCQFNDKNQRNPKNHLNFLFFISVVVEM